MRWLVPNLSKTRANLSNADPSRWSGLAGLVWGECLLSNSPESPLTLAGVRVNPVKEEDDDGDEASPGRSVGPNRRAAKFPRRPALLPTRPREALDPSLAPEDLSAHPIVLVS